MSPEAGWILQEEVVPRLRSAISRTVNCVGAEDHDELVQDATAIAAKMLQSAEVAGKRVTPGTIAYYAIQHMKSGRRSTGSSKTDVMGIGTQLNGNVRIQSLDEPAAGEDETGGEIFTLNEVLSRDSEDPATIAGRKMDWDAFIACLSQIEQLVVQFLCAGKTLRDAALQVGLCDSSMQGYRRKLAAKILEFFGVDVLVDLGHEPRWRINLDCTRATQACRYELGRARFTHVASAHVAPA